MVTMMSSFRVESSVKLIAPDQVPDSALITLGWWFVPAICLLRFLMILSILPYAVTRESHAENLRKLGG